ncbi:MAG: BrnT family toxin [Moraxellaceae bacterium]|nr:BrnT family toxin [Moraxellaceae bacterium]
MPTVKQFFDNISFEWDSDKAELAIKEHGVSFEEAITVLLYDDYSFTNEDIREYDGEQRYITIGMSNQGRILYFVWTVRNNCYRMISARKANKHEQRGYQNGK